MTLFNVLQALLFKSYTSPFEKRREYLHYFDFIWKNHCGPIFKCEAAQKFLLGQALSKESGDALHSILAIELSKQLGIFK